MSFSAKGFNKKIVAGVLAAMIGGAILIGNLRDSGDKRKNNQFWVRVVKVIDGDTIAIEGGEVVRYIGIDAPETGRKRSECFGQEAFQRNKELVEGRKVRLEKDVSGRDKYNRLLRYVWLENGVLVNEELVKEGYAKVFTYPPDVKYSERFLRAEKEAREKKLGLWLKCAKEKNNFKAEVKKKIESDFSKKSGLKNINCSQNVYNCSDFSSQQEAQAVFDYCGGVTNDVHHLDADKDGVACESLP